MSLKILVAGCPKDEREPVEQSVRAVLGKRPASESWNVSLVKMGGQWSVSLDCSELRLRGVTFLAPDERLGGSLREALQQAGALPGVPAAASGPASAGGAPAVPADGHAGETRERHTCEKCQAAFEVIYEAQPSEPRQTVAVACPHCWHVNRVPVGSWAATGREYRAEKLRD